MADQADQFNQGKPTCNHDMRFQGMLTVIHRSQHSCDQAELPWKGV